MDVKGTSTHFPISTSTTTTISKGSPFMKSSTHAAVLQNSIAKLPPSSLAALCHRLRVQLIQQRLPQVCAVCRPHLIRPLHKAELNLTQLLRGLCLTCRSLFMTETKDPALAPPVDQVLRSPSPKRKALDNNRARDDRIPPVVASPVSESNSWTTPIKKIVLKITGIIKDPSFVTSLSTTTAPVDVTMTKPPTTTSKTSLVKNIFERMTESNTDWCRYCGTAESLLWRAGPWGPRTLCEEHGVLYGSEAPSRSFSAAELEKYCGESRLDRKRPIVQGACVDCKLPGKQELRKLFQCHSCPRAFHTACFPPDSSSRKALTWYCSPECRLKLAGSQSSSSLSLKARTSRAFSVPTPRRYSKRFDAAGALPSPPPTPASCVGRKRRATTDLGNDVLVCFEPDAVIKRPQRERLPVFTPSYQRVSFPPVKLAALIRPFMVGEERLDDMALLQRHGRYEEVEKNMRLCRPDVLRSLYEGSSAADILCSSVSGCPSDSINSDNGGKSIQ